MFTSKKNRQIIDYQDSYHFRQQQKKRRFRWLKLAILLLIMTLLAVFFAPVALSNQDIVDTDNDFIQGPQLLFAHPHPAMRATLPVDVEANIEINGLVAYAEIKQTFINPHAITLDGKYQFPLPENSAVQHLSIKVGDKTIIGEIMEKKAAKAMYQQARKQGKKASLVEQHRPNLFTNKIANIPAQSTVVVTLKFIMPVAFSNGEFTVRLPLAITQRYQSNPNSQTIIDYSERVDEGENEEQNQEYSVGNNNQYTQTSYRSSPYVSPRASLTTSTSNSRFIANSNLPEPFNMLATSSPTLNTRSVAPSQSSINITLNSGIPITALFSNSHKIKSHALNSNQNAYSITLDKTNVVSNKSFDLRWKLLASNQPQISSFTQEVAGEHYTLLTFFPPETAAAQVIPRDIIFIIDTSGSMQGGAMAQAKTSLQLAILQLNDKDSFNIIAFDNDTESLFPITQMATEQSIKNAQHFIDHLNADGGTEMYRPLSNALTMKKSDAQSVKAIRQIVFITDGAVANEFELMQLLSATQAQGTGQGIVRGSGPNAVQGIAQGNVQRDFRLYTIGIGAAPNGYFMKKAAQFGRGSYVFIQNQDEVQQKMTNFMTKISQPAISNIELILDSQIHQLVEVYPKRIPDLYFGEPLQIALKSQLPIASVQLTGQTASSNWYHQLIIDDSYLSQSTIFESTISQSNTSESNISQNKVSDENSSKGISSLWARRKIESLVDSLVVGANRDQVKMEVIATSLTHQIISPYTSFIAVEKQPEVSTLLAKNNLSSRQKSNLLKANSKLVQADIQAHESLMVAMPQTALGWQLQLLFGIALLLIIRLNPLFTLTYSRFCLFFRDNKHD